MTQKNLHCMSQTVKKRLCTTVLVKIFITIFINFLTLLCKQEFGSSMNFLIKGFFCASLFCTVTVVYMYNCFSVYRRRGCFGERISAPPTPYCVPLSPPPLSPPPQWFPKAVKSKPVPSDEFKYSLL